MREIHKIRAELSRMPTAEYEKHLRNVKKKYAERLGDLYIKKPSI